MARLLYIEASPRKDRSSSIWVARAFVEEYEQPTHTSSFSPAEGYKGLMTGKKVAVVYARGGEYPPGSGGEAFDLQKRYMELVLGFIGLTDPKSIVVEPTLGKPDVGEGSPQGNSYTTGEEVTSHVPFSLFFPPEKAR